MIRRRASRSDVKRVSSATEAVDNLLSNRFKKLKGEDTNKSESSNGNEIRRTNGVPEIEWWDEAVASDPSAITHLIEHPVPLKGTTNMTKQVLPKVIMTPAEREKLRKLTRKAKVQEMQDKIRMGLIKAPAPRMQLKNMMRVLGDSAVAGPSSVEQTVRAQMEQRLQEHEKLIAAKKLTPENRREKNIAKWTRPLEQSSILKVSAYIILRKIHNKIRFKINKNAEQLHLGGFLLKSKLRKEISLAGEGETDQEFYPSLLVVEGSKKSVKRFDRLMLHRIRWDENIASKDDDDDATMLDATDEDSESDTEAFRTGGNGVCVRIFHGCESIKKFIKWTDFEMRDMPSAIRFLTDRGSMHYWEMMTRYRNNALDI
jgi:U4/U6 small nuclear ribonucleoprotein PRP3